MALSHRVAAATATFVLCLGSNLSLAQPSGGDNPTPPSHSGTTPNPGSAPNPIGAAPADVNPKEEPPKSEPVVLPPVGHNAHDVAKEPVKEHKPAASKWYDRLSVRGYAQIRYNRLGHDIGSLTGGDALDNDKLINPGQDKSLGPKNGINFRRARLILSGDVHDQVFFYYQLDAANAVADDKQNFMQIRDLYADLSLDKKKEFRFRVGQSKVPFGWENMQSSSNRMPIDRTDALNSAVPGERDLGVFFYWAPASRRALFKSLVDDGLKGSGDFGVLALGVYDGQAANIKEMNDNRHVVARLTWPQRLWGKQIVEASVGGYVGKYHAYPKDAKADDAIPEADITDWRGHATIVWYPAPIGFQSEITWGRGPERVKDASGNKVFDDRSLFGGYAMVMGHVAFLYPYFRYQWYDGGRKEADAPHIKSQEMEGGMEWHFGKHVELVSAFAWAKRAIGDRGAKQEEGRALRLQLQLNY